MNNIKNKYMRTYLLVFIVLFLMFMFEPYGNGHDFDFHVTRIIQLADNIRNGNVVSKIYLSSISGYGYSNPMFYGDLFLYPFSFLLILGVPTKYIANIVICFFTILGIFISNLVSKKIFRNDLTAFAFTMLYIFSPYYSINVFQRFALGEIIAYIFIPLVILGYWSIIYDNGEYWLWLPIGLSFVTYSHLLSTIITVLILFVISLFNIKRIFEIKAYKKIVVSVLVYFGVSAYYVFPMLEQVVSDSFLATNGQTATIMGTLKERTLPTTWIFSDFNIYKSYSEWIPNGVGYFPVVLLIISFFKKNKTTSFYFFWLLGFIFAFATSHRFPWDSLQSICSIIQFPWRLQLYSILFFAISACILLNFNDSSNKAIALILVFMSLTSFVHSAYPTYKEILNKEFINYDFGQENYGTYDYLHPVEKEGRLLNHIEISDYYNQLGEKALSNNLVEDSYTFNRIGSVSRLEYTGNNYEDTYVDLPLIMYKGYKAVDDKGKEIKISYGEYNVVRVYLPSSGGEIIVEYKGTIIQKISLLVTGISSACLIITIVKKKKDNDYENKR